MNIYTTMAALIGAWHVMIGVLLLTAPEVNRVASLYVYTLALEHWLFVIGGALAIISYRAKTYMLRCFMLAPQQYLLISTGGGVINTIASQQYPDGTQSPTITHAFLAADQGVYLLLAALHLLLFFNLGRANAS